MPTIWPPPSLGRSRVAEPDQEDGAAVDRRHVDRAAERDRQARLQVKAVQRVDDADIRIVRWPAGRVGQREIDSPVGQLARIGHGEPVARERAAVGRVQVERRKRAQQTTIFQKFKMQPAGLGAHSHDQISSHRRSGLRYNGGTSFPAQNRAPGRCRAGEEPCLAVRPHRPLSFGSQESGVSSLIA